MTTNLAGISLIVSVVLAGISLIVSVVSLAASLFGAWYLQTRYGDVAGVLLDWDHQKKDAKRARVTAFESLINEVARIRELVKYYESPGPPPFGAPKMPMAAFETAFISGSPGLVASSELLQAVSEYLVRADVINSVIDIYLASLHKGAMLSDINSACAPLSKILKGLEDGLKGELEA